MAESTQCREQGNADAAEASILSESTPRLLMKGVAAFLKPQVDHELLFNHASQRDIFFFTQNGQWWTHKCHKMAQMAQKGMYLAVRLQALHVLMGLLHTNARQSFQEVTASKDAHLQRSDSA